MRVRPRPVDSEFHVCSRNTDEVVVRHSPLQPKKNNTIPILLPVYALSLVATFISLFLMDSAQPALLYIVPCTLLPVMLAACARGEFRDMWDGDRETQLVSRVFVNRRTVCCALSD